MSFFSLFHHSPPPPTTRLGRLLALTVRRWFPIMLVAAVVLFPGLPAPWAQITFASQSQASEYELKAVYLFNFLHFVYWPVVEQPEQPRPKAIGIVGSSPLYDALLQLKARLEQSGGEKMTIVNLGPYQRGIDLHGCDLVFISGSEQEHFSAIAAALKNLPVLTVSETNTFLTAGGMISLITLDNKLRWEINRSPVQAAGLRLSAKLLDMASRVVPEP